MNILNRNPLFFHFNSILYLIILSNKKMKMKFFSFLKQNLAAAKNFLKMLLECKSDKIKTLFPKKKYSCIQSRLEFLYKKGKYIKK